MYSELRSMTNDEIKAYLGGMTKQRIVDYYYANVNLDASNKRMYLRKDKTTLINIVLNSYINMRRCEAMEHIVVQEV